MGKDAVVREAIELTSATRDHVAIKVYPLYLKASSPRPWRAHEASGEIEQWMLSQRINRQLPKTFVNLRNAFMTGAKSTQQNPNIHLLYIVTDKYEQTLDSYLKNFHTTMGTCGLNIPCK